MTSRAPWLCGSAEADLTPATSAFLFGYPHVPRWSTGVHDPLFSSALYLSDGNTAALVVANDIIWVPRPLADRARRRISHATRVPVQHIMITATHTHSGPITATMLSNAADPCVPQPDPAYLRQLEDAIVSAAVDAFCAARPATLHYAVASAEGLGTNRNDPAGPSIPQLPVLVARDGHSDRPLAVLCVCSMHPTVLHEDWTLISGDFPGLARRRLNRKGRFCPLVYLMGASGDQSPRHVVRANTIDEAERLGGLLAEHILSGIESARPVEPTGLCCQSARLDLPLRDMPSVAEAEAGLEAARRTFESLRAAAAPRAEVRTAECAVFGAEETLTLARAAAEGRLAEAAASCLPAEVQVFTIGQRVLVGWPGEVFVEFALEVMRACPEAAVVTLANGDLQGYLVTEAAVEQRSYEAGNALFKSPDSGRLLVETTLRLLRERRL